MRYLILEGIKIIGVGNTQGESVSNGVPIESEPNDRLLATEYVYAGHLIHVGLSPNPFSVLDLASLTRVFSKSSAARLEEMSFDLLAKLVDLYNQIVLELEGMEFLK
jgi:hypothetical protein